MDKKVLNKKRSREICDFFLKHPNIKRDPICFHVGFDSSNLLKVIKNEKWNITAKYLSDFERQLKKYGFEPFQEPKTA